MALCAISGADIYDVLLYMTMYVCLAYVCLSVCVCVGRHGNTDMPLTNDDCLTLWLVD